jgi:hypothetical protein
MTILKPFAALPNHSRLVGLLLAAAFQLGLTSGAVAQTPPAPEKKAATRADINNKSKQTATAKHAADDALTPGELLIAERVQTGRLPCELGNSVTLTPDPKSPGYFDVRVKNLKFRMFPVETSTGAIRLEDRKAGAVWLQLANKSMLMNQKLGQRLADACMSPAQEAVAAALAQNPGQSVLDTPATGAPSVSGSPAVTTK